MNLDYNKLVSDIINDVISYFEKKYNIFMNKNNVFITCSNGKINDNHKEKYIEAEPFNYSNNITKGVITASKLVEVNTLLDKIKVNSTIQTFDKKKMKEDYKKNIKEKNYSKSIDTNNPKNKIGLIGTSVTNVIIGGINMNPNQEISTNRIKINKFKK